VIPAFVAAPASAETADHSRHGFPGAAKRSQISNVAYSRSIASISPSTGATREVIPLLAP
jgi:hypothetical protein